MHLFHSYIGGCQQICFCWGCGGIIPAPALCKHNTSSHCTSLPLYPPWCSYSSNQFQFSSIYFIYFFYTPSKPRNSLLLQCSQGSKWVDSLVLEAVALCSVIQGDQFVHGMGDELFPAGALGSILILIMIRHWEGILTLLGYREEG